MNESTETKNIRIKEAFDKLYQHQRKLTGSQEQFIRGLKIHFRKNKDLSERQTSALFTMAKYIEV